MERVSFLSYDETLIGHLDLPKNAPARVPAVAILGPMTFVKEQAPTEYAARLASLGFAACARTASFSRDPNLGAHCRSVFAQ